MRYFDWTATSPMGKRALEVYADTAVYFPGNPSSTHPLGVLAKQRLEDERKAIASMLGCPASELYFTSGGTESNAIILSSLLRSPNPGEIITTGIEHAAVLEFRNVLEAAGWKFTALPCPGGYLEPERLEEALNDKVRMVCVMRVNNVTGTVLDIKGIASVVRKHSAKTGRPIHIHCDAVQALGKIPFSIKDADIDSASFSAHKFCGPRGVGMLWCRNKAVQSLSRGGGQEKGLRPGTENLAGICAMGAELKLSSDSLKEYYDKVLGFRCKIEEASLASGYTLLSPSKDSGKEFSPYIINICVKPVPSEVFLRVMSDKGFCLSAGSACSSNSRGKAESVLAAMNIDHERRMSSIRISMGRDTTEEDVSALCTALREASSEFGIGK